MLIRQRNTYGTRWMTHDRCMQIEMAEGTQRACMHAIAEAWLPVLLRNCCVPPMTVDDAGPAPGAFDDGFAGLQLYEFVG
jgi:hypothetical protein